MVVSAYRAGPLRGHEATPDRATGERNLRDFSHARPIQIGRNETCSLILMSAFEVNAEVRGRPSHSGRVRLAWLLLMAMCWGFQQPSLKQGAAGTVHFEPGGVAFWDN